MATAPRKTPRKAPKKPPREAQTSALQGRILPVPFTEALSERYMAYAMSTITARSLPDVRDGLKPVHRRLLHAMRELRLNPRAPRLGTGPGGGPEDKADDESGDGVLRAGGPGFKKCARIVGDVMGKYHPHGDAAIYDAMVRLAQEFSVRYPLVDGQGNFGNIDGDGAAAMRYTEARLTEVARRLLEGIDEDACEFRETYDGEGSEPVVLPANFPHLLANGATGIAVGMATSIPPHNVDEICDALLHLLDLPRGQWRKAPVANLVTFIRGPDFPSGGVLRENPETILEAYETGRGSFRLRARWKVEKIKGGARHIVIDEIPYRVQKARLIERIAELLHERKLPMVDDIRDESAEMVRVVVIPKSRTVDPDILMESLFRQTDLEIRTSLNMNVLKDGRVPGVMNLRDVLIAYLEHRHDVLVRRKKFREAKVEARLEVLDGYLIAYLNLDKVIRIIREEDNPRGELIRAFKLTENQAEAILDMRLRLLRKLHEAGIHEEHVALQKELKAIRALLKSPSRRWKAVSTEIVELKNAFGPKTALGNRRTEIADAPAAAVIPLEATVEREPVTVICSEQGWIRAVRGHLESFDGVKFRDGDSHRFGFHTYTTDRLLVMGTNGRIYTVQIDRLPGGRGQGEPLRLMCDLPREHDIADLVVHRPAQKLLLAASDGRGFVVKEDDIIGQTRNGRQVLNLGDSVQAVRCVPIPPEADHVAVVGKNRKLLVFPLSQLPVMTRGRGIIMQRYTSGSLADAKAFRIADGLNWKIGQRMRTEDNIRGWIGKRAQAGFVVPRGFSGGGTFG